MLKLIGGRLVATVPTLLGAGVLIFFVIRLIPGDAIDAMLSDRPYRRALAVPQVKDQLQQYAAVQFDARIVNLVINSTILERHAAEVALSRSDAGRPAHPFDSKENHLRSKAASAL